MGIDCEGARAKCGQVQVRYIRPIRVIDMAAADNCMTQLVDRMPQNQTNIISDRRWLWGKAPCLNEGIWYG